MRSAFQILIFWAIAIGNLSFSNVLVACQEDEQTVDEERLDFVVDRCVLSIRDSVRNSLDLKIDFIQRFLAVDDDGLRKIRVYSKGLSAKHARLYRKPIRDRLQRFATQLDGSTFTINEQSYTFDGEEDDVPAFKIKISLLNQHSTGSMTVSYSNRSSGFGIRSEGNKKLAFESSDNFRKALSAVDKEKLKAVRKTIELKRKQNLIDGMAVMLGEKLRLDKDQMPRMKVWVEEHIADVSDVPIYQQIRDQFRKRQVFVQDPDFLSDIQLEAWRILRNSQYPFGW